MAYKFGILTSLYDDEAPRLLATLDRAIEDGLIEGKVPIVLCDRMEGKNPEVNARIEQVRHLVHLDNLVFLPPSSVEYKGDHRIGYDRAAAEMLHGSGASSFLNIGYMRIMTSLIYDQFDIVNLHPALPEVGPVGRWPDVMKEQAARPLGELSAGEEMHGILQKMHYRGGGMLHIVSGNVDRGPVMSWYDFSLTTPRLAELWARNADNARRYGIETSRAMPDFTNLAAEIRREQVQGEHPLLVLTYSKLSRGEWSIRDKTLYVGDQPHPGGVCMTREVGNYLRSAGIETAMQ